MRRSALAIAVVVASAFGSMTAAFGRVAQGLSPNPSSTLNIVRAVSSVDRRAWAVGSYEDDTTDASQSLILEHVNRDWVQVGSPDPSSTDNELFDVVALSVDDAWAVGEYDDDTTGAQQTLIVHWNGASWTQVRSPDPSDRFNVLDGISATGPRDIWAVGYYQRGIDRTLTLHWSGRRWIQVKSPNPDAQGNHLLSVSAQSSDDVWAVGYVRVSAGQSLTLHWNGDRWRRIPSPDPRMSGRTLLFGVSATRSSNAWAVGGYLRRFQHNLIMHWDGHRWSIIDCPDPRSTDNFLNDVSARTGSDAWVVGHHRTSAGVYRTVTAHWDGSRWRRVASPNPSREHGPYGNQLLGVLTMSRRHAWAVGSYIDHTTKATRTLILWMNDGWHQQ